MTSGAKFWDKIADKYAASPVKDEAAYAQTLERVRAYLTPETKLLEVGCGTGTTALKLAGDARHITASDISANMLAIAEGKAKHARTDNVTFVQAALPDDRFDPEAFDVVLASSLLHLVEDLPAVIAGLRDALKPGGVFISKTVCLGSKAWLWVVPLALMRLIGKAPYVNLLTPEALDQAIAEGGFEIIETGFYPAPHARFVVARKV